MSSNQVIHGEKGKLIPRILEDEKQPCMAAFNQFLFKYLIK